MFCLSRISVLPSWHGRLTTRASGSDRAAREFLTESGESKRTERRPKSRKATSRPWNQEKIDDDAEQPRRHNVRADSWTHGNEHGGGHLNDSDESMNV